ncbi:MAG: outer membrane lipoprotein carrier protein LolA [Bacteroidales bacterium]|nr:outer membrane lipoprotein carrier protein LolA [Bacteroidales bacterium]MBN2819701.1 outer membrane lipoprotein carrier protein LolA [Bacteroidales bacterium]
MKQLFVLVIAINFFSLVTAQDEIIQDTAAQRILDNVSLNINSYETIIADFELNIDNRMEDLHSKSSGTIFIKGNKYYMESLGTQVYYNGKTMWSYMPDIKEVTITEPDESEGDFVDNPALIFSFYKRDFKYRLVGEVKVENNWMYEIELYPKDLNQPYSRFKLYVEKGSNDLYMVKAISKDAIDYTIYILNTKFNKEVKDDKFSFKEENFPGIEIIDMRF